MPKAKKAKKNAPEVAEVPAGNACMVDERMESVIGKLFVSSFTRLHQIIQKEVVEMCEEEYRWAEELLEEVRREFARWKDHSKWLPYKFSWLYFP